MWTKMCTTKNDVNTQQAKLKEDHSYATQNIRSLESSMYHCDDDV